MKVRLSLILLLIASVIIAVASAIMRQQEKPPQNLTPPPVPAIAVNPNVKTAHIYGDLSSFPTMLQLVDLVKTSRQEPKFIFWKRMTELNAQDPVLKNALIYNPHPDLPTKTYWASIQKALSAFVQAYPNASFVLHINRNHNFLVWSFLKSVPLDRIKRVHFYEESYAFSIFNDVSPYPAPKEQTLQALYSKETPSPAINFMISLLDEFPATMHMAVDKENAFYQKLLSYPNVTVQHIDFEQMARSLTPAQKQDLLRLTNVPPEIVDYFEQGKPVALYTLGYFWDNKKFNKKQLCVLQTLMEGKHPDLPNPQDYIWLYKEHPWPSKNTFLQDSISKKWPQAKRLPKEFPLEILFLAGYWPDKVFGYSSSIFFALPQKRILFFIQRDKDPYLPLLKKWKHLSDKQVKTLDDFVCKSCLFGFICL